MMYQKQYLDKKQPRQFHTTPDSKVNTARIKRLESISARWNEMNNKPVVVMDPRLVNPVYGRITEVETDTDKNTVEVFIKVFPYKNHPFESVKQGVLTYVFSASREHESNRVWIYEIGMNPNEEEPSIHRAILQLQPNEFYSIVMRPPEFKDYMQNYDKLLKSQVILTDDIIDKELIDGGYVEDFCN